VTSLPLLNGVSSTEILNRKSWFFGSGCTTHMCSQKDLFTELEDFDETVYLASDSITKAKGIGKVMLNSDDRDIQLEEVLYVPDLRSNFISISKIVDKKFDVKFTSDIVIVSKNNEVIMKGERVENLFMFKSSQSYQQNFLLEEEDKFTQWHRKYGHLNSKDLIKLNDEKMVKGIILNKRPKEFKCETCYKGKIATQPFSKHIESQSKDVLELVHTDICGPFKRSNGGARYFISNGKRR
jgi:hypothetical protein